MDNSTDQDDMLFFATQRGETYQSAPRKSHMTTESAINDAWVRSRTAVVNIEDAYEFLNAIGERRMSRTLQEGLRRVDEVCSELEEMSMDKFNHSPGR